MSEEENRFRVSTANMLIEELAKIEEFIAISRSYGVSVTATPKALELLSLSTDYRAAFIVQNLCPVKADPWNEINRSSPEVMQ